MGLIGARSWLQLSKRRSNMRSSRVGSKLLKFPDNSGLCERAWDTVRQLATQFNQMQNGFGTIQQDMQTQQVTKNHGKSWFWSKIDTSDVQIDR
jgi:hypothetical protein